MKGSTGIKRFYLDHLKKQHWKRKFLTRFLLERTIKKDFKKKKGFDLNLNEPQILDEKLQWFKYYVRDPLLPYLVDKVKVREYVREILGDEYLIPQYGVYTSVEEINLDALPEEFILKPNHMSGETIICRKGEKNKIDWKGKADEMKRWLRENYYYFHGEWAYKDIIPAIICEYLLKGEIIDYKFFCINGTPLIAEIIGSRDNSGINDEYVDLNFSQLNFHPKNANAKPFHRPTHWTEMIELAGVLSKGFPFVRVDLYDLEGRIYFGELTFTPTNGMSLAMPPEWNKKLGNLYDLAPFRSELEREGKVLHWYQGTCDFADKVYSKQL